MLGKLRKCVEFAALVPKSRHRKPMKADQCCVNAYSTPAPNVHPVWNWLELAAVMLACGLIPPMTLNGADGFVLCWPSSHAQPPLA